MPDGWHKCIMVAGRSSYIVECRPHIFYRCFFFLRAPSPRLSTDVLETFPHDEAVAPVENFCSDFLKVHLNERQKTRFAPFFRSASDQMSCIVPTCEGL